MKQHLGQVESDSVGESFKAIPEFTSAKKIYIWQISWLHFSFSVNSYYQLTINCDFCSVNS